MGLGGRRNGSGARPAAPAEQVPPNPSKAAQCAARCDGAGRKTTVRHPQGRRGRVTEDGL